MVANVHSSCYNQLDGIRLEEMVAKAELGKRTATEAEGELNLSNGLTSQDCMEKLIRGVSSFKRFLADRDWYLINSIIFISIISLHLSISDDSVLLLVSIQIIIL